MKIISTIPLLAALAIAGAPVQAQTSSSTKVTTGTTVDDGVATHKTKVTHVTKRKTHRAKKILGVKVGHKTVTHKTVRTTSASSNGDASTSVTTK